MPRTKRRGLSLIELLVAVAVLGLIVALLLTAVIRAREAARRARCASNLRNLAVALSHHQTTRGAFPTGAGDRSFLWALLPFLGQDALSRTVLDDRTAAVPIPGLFLCPSDARRPAPMARFATSYGGNAGTFGREPVSGWDGMFTEQPLKPDEVTDGLSFTAAVAEWVVGEGDVGNPSRLGSITILDGDFAAAATGPEAFVGACEGAVPGRTGLVVAAFKGSYWFRGRLGHSLYTHALPPNRPSCRAAPDLNAITAGSRHGGGAHVLTLDGGARFVRDTVAPEIWRALGTRAGAEAVAADSY
jgi:prepilin-type N-terminal cleavage/methylation domain-containing protein/prepilin-type processing-associated H-X9-DG protein